MVYNINRKIILVVKNNKIDLDTFLLSCNLIKVEARMKQISFGIFSFLDENFFWKDFELQVFMDYIREHLIVLHYKYLKNLSKKFKYDFIFYDTFSNKEFIKFIKNISNSTETFNKDRNYFTQFFIYSKLSNGNLIKIYSKFNK